jgi:hypothetical protein
LCDCNNNNDQTVLFGDAGPAPGPSPATAFAPFVGPQPAGLVADELGARREAWRARHRDRQLLVLLVAAAVVIYFLRPGA